MLDKNVDMLLMGKSFLSYMLALELLDQNQKVLLLDDSRIQFGELYTNGMCELEKEFLKTWGEDRDIPPLWNLEEFISYRPITFVFDQKRIRLGDEPSRNLRELCRKFPEAFYEGMEPFVDEVLNSNEKAKEFNKGFFDYCSSVGKNFFRYQSPQSLSMDEFFQDCPPVLKSLFDSFSKRIINKDFTLTSEYWHLKTFLYMTRGYYQKKLSINASEFELFHLFLCLLSPNYELEHKSLIDKLENVHQDRGGQFKTTNVRDLFFSYGKPWSIELESFEGVIHPKKMCLLGGVPIGLPLKLDPIINCYTCYKVVLEVNGGFLNGFDKERFVYSTLNKLGTSQPMWEGTFYSDKIVIRAFMTKKPGSKPEFIENKLYNAVVPELESIVPGISEAISSKKVFESREIWIDEIKSATTKKKGQPPLPRKVRLLDTSIPGKKSPLRGVHYFGPYKEGPLGLLSSLLEIKDGGQFM